MVLPRAGHSCHSWLFRHGREGGWGGANGVSRPQCINISHTSREWWDQPLYKSHLHNSRWEGEWGKLITIYSRSCFWETFSVQGCYCNEEKCSTEKLQVVPEKKYLSFSNFSNFLVMMTIWTILEDRGLFWTVLVPNDPKRCRTLHNHTKLSKMAVRSKTCNFCKALFS